MRIFPDSNSRRAWTVAIILAGCASCANADDIAFITTGSAQFGTIDLSTGAFTSINSNLGVQLAGLGTLDGVLYGAAYQAEGLYQVNTATGQLSVVGNGVSQYADFGSTLTGLFGLDSTLNLFSINPLTGATTIIGPTGLSHSPGQTEALSTGSNTLNFFIGNSTSSTLYTVNTSTGIATEVGSAPWPDIGAAVTESDGVSYAGSDLAPYGIFASSPFGQVATQSGASTTNGPFWGLAPDPLPAASTVPEPDTAAMLADGLVLVALVRSWCRRFSMHTNTLNRAL